jgi:hypothetical protein
MLKFLLILGLAVYIVYKVGSFFFRAGAASQQFRNQHQGRSSVNSNDQSQKGKKKGPTLKGGEYIDYEDVK